MKTFSQKTARWIAIALIAVSAILLAIPGQFYHTSAASIYHYSGYEMIFHYAVRDGANGLKSMGRASAAGIIALILCAFALASSFVPRKGAALPIASGVALAIASILFFAMQGALKSIYHAEAQYGLYTVLWVSYVVASLLLVAAIILILEGHYNLHDNQNVTAHHSGYSYLTSNKKKEK